MDLNPLLKSTEIGTVDGISLQDLERVQTWLRFGETISKREEGIVLNGYVLREGDPAGANPINIVLKTNLDYKCLSYEYLVGLEVNKLNPVIPNFIQTHGLFLIRNPDYDPNAEELGSYGEYIPYLMIEKVMGEQIDKVFPKLTEQQLNHLMLQLVLLLQVSQNIIDFTHYDLHLGNILYVELPEPIVIHYRIGPNNNFDFSTNYLLKVIDYGYSHARLTTIPNGLYACVRHQALIEGIVPSVKDPLTDIMYFTSKGLWDYLANQYPNEHWFMIRNVHHHSFSSDFLRWLLYGNLAKQNYLSDDGHEDKFGEYVYAQPMDTLDDKFFIPQRIQELTKPQFDQKMKELINYAKQNWKMRPRVEHINDISYKWAELISGYKLHIVKQRPDQDLSKVIEYLTEKFLLLNK